MKHLVLIFSILISISNITYGQANLFEKYPFNEAVSIKLISYSNMDSTQPYWKSQSCIEIPLLNNALNGTHVDFTRLDKVETINLLEAAKLYKIAYGDNFNCTVPIRPTNCNDVKSGYGILFLDQDDRIFTLLNFCFECKKWSRIEGELFEPICDEKMKLIKELFINNGFEIK